MEKLMEIRATEFIINNNILYNNKFDFRAGYSTTDAILHYTDDVVTALDNRLLFYHYFP